MTEAEFLPLFDQYRPMVYGLALSYTRSPQDAEDVCQEVFLTLLESPLPQGRSAPGWPGWRSTAAGICFPPPGAGGGRTTTRPWSG